MDSLLKACLDLNRAKRRAQIVCCDQFVPTYARSSDAGKDLAVRARNEAAEKVRKLVWAQTHRPKSR